MFKADTAEGQMLEESDNLSSSKGGQFNRLIQSDVTKAYQFVRHQSLELIASLSDEDMVAQSMPDASPTKWHLGHTSWFFETFILSKFSAAFSWFDENFCHIFNSYYESVGSRHARPQRGLLTRPSVSRVLEYRAHVDAAMIKLLAALNTDDIRQQVEYLTTVGLHHEMQHQELMQTDLLHLLSHNPIWPSAKTEAPSPKASASLSDLSMIQFDGGLVEVGISNSSKAPQAFYYDCEGPCHSVYLQPYRIANRLVTNREWLAFMQDDGYKKSLLWLSDGWHTVNKLKWDSPLYWEFLDGEWYQFGLDGLQLIDWDAPVSHVSFYEADAFARWQNKRLPSEFEWENAVNNQEIAGNFLEKNIWRPQASSSQSTPILESAYGDVWEWTQSPFTPFPGFKPQMGALGEYNGKFMSNQYVLKGGSCVTPQGQMRAQYRNFFYPFHRWQFTGLRLAEDV